MRPTDFYDVDKVKNTFLLLILFFLLSVNSIDCVKLNGSAVCADKLEKQEILTFFVQDAHKFTTLLLGNRNSCSMLGFTRILISKVESYRWMGLIIFRVTGMSSRTKRSFITLNVTTYCEFKQFQYFCLIFAIYGLRAYWLIFFTYLHTTWFFIFFLWRLRLIDIDLKTY